jgi:hypothetical protein
VWNARGWHKPFFVLTAFCAVLAWWLTLRPTNDADWQPNVTHTSQIVFNGDTVTIHNFRNCDYRSEHDYLNCWSDLTVNLRELHAVDFFLINWGIPHISHTIVSFDFGNQHVAFSIEARYRRGQGFSAIRGFFRQFALAVVVSAETDVIRLRTNFRKNEEVYLYRTSVRPETVRSIFRTYASLVNSLHDRPQWYNAITRNCTTAIYSQIAAKSRTPRPRDLRVLLSGSFDEYLYDHGRLVTGGLSFPALKAQAHINPVAHNVSDLDDFSAAIRRGRVGF